MPFSCLKGINVEKCKIENSFRNCFWSISYNGIIDNHKTFDFNSNMALTFLLAVVDTNCKIQTSLMSLHDKIAFLKTVILSKKVSS